MTVVELEKPSEIGGERLNLDFPLADLISSDSSDFCGDASKECLLGLNGVVKIFEGGVVGVKEATVRLMKGDFVSLIGPNQSGKTTLLRLIASQERPTKGEIVFDGASSRDLKKSQIPIWRRKLGLILDDLNLIPDLSVFDNVALSLRIMGKAERKVGQLVMQALKWVGLSSKSRSLPVRLSSAEQQKAAIARAIVRNPLLLLADEPTTNLDKESALEIMELFYKINLFGTAVLLTSTESSPDNGFPGRVIKMENGRAVDADFFLSVEPLAKAIEESSQIEPERVTA